LRLKPIAPLSRAENGRSHDRRRPRGQWIHSARSRDKYQDDWVEEWSPR